MCAEHHVASRGKHLALRRFSSNCTPHKKTARDRILKRPGSLGLRFPICLNSTVRSVQLGRFSNPWAGRAGLSKTQTTCKMVMCGAQ